MPRHSYQRILDPNAGDSIAKVARLVAPGSKVLDVGCGPGVLGAYLAKEKNCIVDGIEINKEDALIARSTHRKVAAIDLETTDPKQALDNEKYDYIVCADVLEHLRDPERAVQRLRQMVAPTGRFLISIPNVAYSGLIAALIEGQWQYTVEGLLDSTHVRFFTRSSLLEWLPAQGLKPISIDTVDVPFDRSEFNMLKMDGYPPALLNALLSRPDATSYQFIIEAVPTEPRLARAELKQFTPSSRSATVAFYVQLYFGRNGGLSEAESVRVPGRIAVDRQRIQLQIPAQKHALDRLRLDLADRPGVIRLYDITLHDAAGESLWKWDGQPSLVDRGRDLEIVSTEPGVLHLLCADDPQIDLPLDKEILARLHDGGRLSVELSWPASHDGYAIAQRYFGSDEQMRRIRELTSSVRAGAVKLADTEAELRRTLAEKQRLNTLHSHRLRREAELEAQLAHTKSHVTALESKLGELEGALDAMRRELEATHGSAAWRYTRPLRSAREAARDASRQVEKSWLTLRHQGVRGWIRRRSEPPPPPPGAPDPAPDLSYLRWTRLYDTMDEAKRAEARAAIAAMPTKPKISVVVPTYNTEEKFLRAMIESVRSQIYPNWELCIADDASPNPDVREILTEYMAKDPRIKVVFRKTNGHISEASNSAIELVTGEWIALLDHDDILPEHALFMVARYILRHPEGKLFYSDEDKLTTEGERSDPYFKSDWNPELILAQNMFSHLGVYQTALVKEVGGFRQGFEGSQDHDLLLRCVERAGDDRVVHIPHILYHWRMTAGSTSSALAEKPYALLATTRAIQEHLDRMKIRGMVSTAIRGTNMMRVRYALPDSPPLVSIIIPCRDKAELTRMCVDSLYAKTVYPNWEVVIVDNGSVEASTLALFDELEVRKNVRILHDDRPFNFAALNNMAVQEAKGEYVCLLNNDIEVISADWLSELMSHATRSGCGAVGASLWYPNDTLQHGGVLVGIADVAGHMHHLMPRGHFGHFGRAVLTQNVTAVTAACLVVKKSIFQEVGGINEELAVAFNDVDFCLRVRKAGYRNVYAPHAELYHHESASRGSDQKPETRARFLQEAALMKRIWGSQVEGDPFYNPNLANGLAGPVFAPAFPPRIGMLD